jgi:hypothetical protein
MSDDLLERCRRCGGRMVRVSAEDTSPLIVECEHCGHQEHAEIQLTPPWPGVSDAVRVEPAPGDVIKTERSGVNPSGCPVTVGGPEDRGAVIPFGCIVVVGAALLAAIGLLVLIL